MIRSGGIVFMDSKEQQNSILENNSKVKDFGHTLLWLINKR